MGKLKEDRCPGLTLISYLFWGCRGLTTKLYCSPATCHELNQVYWLGGFKSPFVCSETTLQNPWLKGLLCAACVMESLRSRQMTGCEETMTSGMMKGGAEFVIRHQTKATGGKPDWLPVAVWESFLASLNCFLKREMYLISPWVRVMIE